MFIWSCSSDRMVDRQWRNIPKSHHRPRLEDKQCSISAARFWSTEVGWFWLIHFSCALIEWWDRYKFGLIVELVSGAFHNLALTKDDEVRGFEILRVFVHFSWHLNTLSKVLTWGWNLRGQLGSASPSQQLLYPPPWLFVWFCPYLHVVWFAQFLYFSFCILFDIICVVAVDRLTRIS